MKNTLEEFVIGDPIEIVPEPIDLEFPNEFMFANEYTYIDEVSCETSFYVNEELQDELVNFNECNRLDERLNYHTIYKITNKTNDKIYIGAHISGDLVSDFYYGKGKKIMEAITDEGLGAFTKEILHVFTNKDDMFKKESEIVNQDFIKREDTYNIRIGGGGNRKGSYTHTKENKKMLSKVTRNSNLTRSVQSNQNKMWVFNPITSKQRLIFKHQFDLLKEHGWIKGRKAPLPLFVCR